jgi:hypothetical protein
MKLATLRLFFERNAPFSALDEDSDVEVDITTRDGSVVRAPLTGFRVGSSRLLLTADMSAPAPTANQRQRIRTAVADLVRDALNDKAFAELDAALGEAQNRPEHGGAADGSVDEDYWRAASELLEAIGTVRTYAPWLKGGAR